MRFGSSQHTLALHHTPHLRLHALLLSAVQAHHGVVRIPHSYITPLDDAARGVMRHITAHHHLRLVIHAPIVPPRYSEALLYEYGQFLTDIAVPDGVIICHMPTDTAHEWAFLATLPDALRRMIAIELTTQSIDTICGRAYQHGIPIIFDWLHYHLQAPWPYTPVAAALACMHTWPQHRPLIHLSSPDTADHGVHHTHAHGRHSAYLDWMTHMHFVGTLADSYPPGFDIEIEADAGTAAVTHFLQRCRRQSPVQWHSYWQHPTQRMTHECTD